MTRWTTSAADIAVLDRIQRRVLWLACNAVHHANARPSPDGSKVGGHQASSASSVSLLTALYFRALRPTDVVALKAHASPAFYAIQYLRGRLSASALQQLRVFGELQAYPSRRKNPDIVDLSTGSMGLGAVAATFGALAGRYLVDHSVGLGAHSGGLGAHSGGLAADSGVLAPHGGGPVTPARFIVMVGDAELDEGNVWEALAEETVAHLGNVLWIVDFNRQSLDRVIPDARRAHLRELFRASGWRVRELRWGRRLQALFARPDGERLRTRMASMPNAEYQHLLRQPAGALRKALVSPAGDTDATLDRLLANVPDADLPGLVADVGGHDLAEILDVLAEADETRESPMVIVADTIKGWGLPMAGDPLNHTALMTQGQLDELRESMGITPGQEWAGFAEGSDEARWIGGVAPLFQPSPLRQTPAVPDELGEDYPDNASTQEAFGRALGALGRLPIADVIVTVSADVAITTHLAGWINRKGVYAPRAKRDFFADTPQAMRWKESPTGQHIELGIAEHNLFLLLGALGLTAELSGTPLLPIGTLYDPFVTRGLDALYHALYSGGRFIVAATPSGVTLSPEGGAHQSVITPGIGLTLPSIAFFDPVFAREVEWILLEGLGRLVARGESLYLRLSTKAIDQRLAPPPAPEYRAAVLRGGYRLIDARGEAGYAPEDAVHLFAEGVMVPETVAAARALREQDIFANVFAVTSPDRLYRGLREPRPYLETLVGADEEGVPVVSALDGHSHTLAFIGSALGVSQLALGVDDFGQSGARADLYRHYGIDAEAVVRAALTLLGRP